MKILFVCTANRFRSKTEEAVATKFFGDKCIFDSCGIGSKKFGLSSPLKLRKEAIRMGLDEQIFLKKSKEINLKFMKDFDLIVVQQKNHIDKLSKLYPKYKDKIVHLGDFYKVKINRIPDLAFISDIEEYRKAIKLISICTRNLVRKYVR